MSRLNLTRGVSLSHIQDASANPTVTNNITIRTESATTQEPSPDVTYPEVTPIRCKASEASFEAVAPAHLATVIQRDASEQDEQPEGVPPVDEIEFLKSIIRIYMNQTFTFEGKRIVCTIDELSSLIKALTGGDVTIEASDLDIECGCCGTTSTQLKQVDKIWVERGDVRTVFRYSYPQFLYLFEQYNISLKFIH